MLPAPPRPHPARRSRLAVAALGLAAFGLAAFARPAAAAPIDHAALAGSLEGAVGGFIQPGYRAFDAEAGAMQTAMTTLCNAPSAEHHAAAQAQFSKLVSAWSRVEMLRFGPALEDNRVDRILFYPDRKGLGLKQVKKALAARDESVTDAGRLQGKSIAMQGLTTLDILLSGTGSAELDGPQGDHRCRFGKAVSGAVALQAGTLRKAWDQPDGIARDFAHPGPDNALFRDDTEAATALLGFFVHGAETLRDQRLKPIFDPATGKASPKAALFWRSGATWTALSGNLDGLSDLWQAADMQALLPADQQSTAASILFVLKGMQGVAGKLDPALAEAATKPEEQKKYAYLMLNGEDLIERLSEGYGKAIGLSAGFSFGDGD